MSMKPWLKIVLVALPAAVVGSLFQSNGPIGAMIWPPAAGVSPTASQLAWLIPLGLVEALAFGLGVAFLVFGWPYVRAAPGVGRGLAAATYASVGFGLVSWVPHIAMHTSAGSDFDYLILTDALWHVPLIAAAAVTATFFVRVLGARKPAEGTLNARADDVPLVAR